MKPKLMIVVGVDWSLVLHRLPIALEAMRHGYEVHVATAITDKYAFLVSQGLVVHPLPMHRGSTNPFTELRTFLHIWWLFITVRPDIVHLVTIKPVLYGGIAARFSRVKAVVAAVTGLGFVFLAHGAKASVVKTIAALMYRFALGKKNIRVIFQNPDDKEKIQALTGLPEAKSIMIRGSGADLSQFLYRNLPPGPPLVMLASRLLRDKGVVEFVEAARMLKQKGLDARFCLVGKPDPENPTSLKESDLNAWAAEGVVETWGFQSDMAEMFSQASIVVLPSYGEGLPKVLIEAAACGRAVITTDVPGCRDAIEENITGLLVAVKNSQALADAIETLVSDPSRCAAMGKAGRALAEKEFDIASVVNKHMEIYTALL